MAKNTNAQKSPVNNGKIGKHSDEEKTPQNPWTENFVQIAQYLVKDYRDKVIVSPEFPLFQKPMEIDAVIIIQEDGLVIDNALMRSFKRHNIIEFKSPNDTLNICAFDKTISYFYAYLSNEHKNHKPPIEADDVTLSLISVRRPKKLLETLQEKRKYKIVDTNTPGIYYIIKEGFIPEKIQLVISSELPNDESDQSLAWLRSLRNDLTVDEAVEIVKKTKNIDDYESILSIVKFILSVNLEILPEVEMKIKDPRWELFLWNVARDSGTAEKLANMRAEERAKEMAKTMLLDGEPVEKIAKYTRLDIADIVMLQSEIVNA